ncbi:ISH9-type transposase [Halorubrum californiense DSM 19288]|uniref:ISH9-type transposase n=1 Tax=Halorubrum californiense DSM 19288 TaxID=1227465 RepID=M0DX47_9EURY|nr:ISH9-type transposase [Halorubrum californiense DSM 19288]
MTTNLSGTPSVQRASGPCCAIGCSLRYDHAHNARLDSGLYGQRWMAETSFSVIKRRFVPAVHPRAWYREFRELVLTATVYNLEQALKQ